MVAALTSGTEAGRELGDLLAKPDPLSEEELLRAAGLVEQAGGKEWAEAKADSALASAAEHLTEADMPSQVRAEFEAIAEFLTARQW